MGYNLNRLMRQYGLATPTMAQYTGEMGPDVETIDEETGETITTPGTLTFDSAKQAEFDNYQDQYQFRLSNRPMYESSQFRTTPSQQQPQTYEDMFTMYLGRQPGDGETNRGPVSDAQRNEFLRTYENEFANLGINNTGNQLVADQIGNYYGNILRNPDFNSTPSNQIDPSADFITRNPSVINPNPPFTGPVMTVDQAYFDPDNPPVVDGEVTDNFLQFANQQDQILANLANPVPIAASTYTDASARAIDPLATASNNVASGFNYLTNNQDVFDHANRVADAEGLAPSVARTDRMNEIAKEHFVDFGRNENRSWYNRGGEVKGYELGGGYTNPYGAERTGVRVEVLPPYDAFAPVPNDQVVPNVKEKETVVLETPSEVIDESQTVDINESQTVDINAADVLNQMLNPSTSTTSRYSPEIQSLSGQQAGAQSAYDEQLVKMIENTQQGPDKAELWFNLASALSAPTKTGTFGESLGLAAKEFGKFSKDTRTSERSAQALQLKMAASKLAKIDNRLNKVKDLSYKDAEKLRAEKLQLYKILTESGIKGQELAIKLSTLYLKKQKYLTDIASPKTEIGKMLKDMNPDIKIGSTLWYNKYEEERARKAQLENKMPTYLGKKVGDLNDQVKTAQASLIQLGLAEKLISLSYDSSPKDIVAFNLQRKADPSNERVRATIQLNRILSGEALQKLKATFGGQISDGEREALEQLSGAKSLSREDRAKVIELSVKALKRLIHNNQADINWFGSSERFKAPYEGYTDYQNNNHKLEQIEEQSG